MSLGFLVPFATILNCILKNLLQIPRPDSALHLIVINDGSFGFPSGDVQVATVFWFAIWKHSLKGNRYNYLKFLYLLPIILIAISRVYLGVHSIYDVIAGVIIGIFTLYIAEKYLLAKLTVDYSRRNMQKLWLLLATMIILYSLVSLNFTWPLMLPMSIGTFIGLYLSLKYVTIDHKNTQIKMNVISAIISLIIVIAFAKAMPVISFNKLVLHSSIIVKFAIIVFAIFVFIPNIVYYIRAKVKKN
ncbi:MAG: phosphatase PAP2 family protein [Rickettsiaceae bacterium]|nr:phosphatase PAP2 family protein [Rickettsiaceae bacterium]